MLQTASMTPVSDSTLTHLSGVERCAVFYKEEARDALLVRHSHHIKSCFQSCTRAGIIWSEPSSAFGQVRMKVKERSSKQAPACTKGALVHLATSHPCTLSPEMSLSGRPTGFVRSSRGAACP